MIATYEIAVRLRLLHLAVDLGRQEDAAVHNTYANVIADATAMISEAILNQENNLPTRATTIDSAVQELLRRVGLAVMTELFNTLAKNITTETEAKGIKVNRRESITYSVLFGRVRVDSPYHWDPVTRRSARPVKSELGLKHQGRSVGVERALSDFGNEESFAQASLRFEEHYGWEVGCTTVLRVVERRAKEAECYVRDRLEQARHDYDEPLATRPGAKQLLIELDGCEIRTGTLAPARSRERTRLTIKHGHP